MASRVVLVPEALLALECVREPMASEACAVFPAWVMYVARDLRVPCLYRISLISVFEGSFGLNVHP